MQTREKNLAIALGAVVGVMGLWTVVKPWYMGPIDNEAAQLALVQSEIDGLENQEMQLIASTRQLAEWKARSLPPDPKPIGRGRADALNGQRLYHEWLTDLARHAGFQSLEVSPSITRAVQDVYVTAQVRLKGQATYSQLCQFLAMFEQTELMHKIESCSIESSDYRGDPYLSINLVAEGMALQNAPIRDELFPVDELKSAIKAAGTKLTVVDADGFPESGRFEIRVGEERLGVVSVKGNEWQVVRGKDKTKPVDHAAGARVDLGLFNPLSGDEPREAHPRLALISQANPFTIPPPKADPYLSVPREETVYLGDQLNLSAKAENFNRSFGPPKFELVGEVPAGMTIAPAADPFESLVSWRPENESLIGTHSVSIQVTRDDFETPITQSVQIYVRGRNIPPTLDGVGSQVVYSGQPLKFKVTAKDEDPGQRLTFSLGAQAPPEAAIDPATGEFSWTPPGVVTEQNIDVEIVVTDDGSPAERASIMVPVQVMADVAHFTRFLGAVLDESANEAWFFDRWNNREFVLKQGETLETADVKAKLIEVQADQLLLSRDGETWTLNAGGVVRDMKPIESAKTAQNK